MDISKYDSPEPRPPTDREHDWFLGLEITTYICGVLLFIFGCYNIYHYLYKQQKYKVYANIIIYTASMCCIMLDMAFAQIVPLTDYCRLRWWFTSYGAAYCNLVVGICQAYLLSALKNQLECLFRFT